MVNYFSNFAFCFSRSPSGKQHTTPPKSKYEDSASDTRSRDSAGLTSAPVSQKIFVGSLPLHITDGELFTYFDAFGDVKVSNVVN